VHVTWERRSRYVAVRDGTRLAAHVFRRPGTSPTVRLPTLLLFDRYHSVSAIQAPDEEGDRRQREWLEALLERGYAVVFVDSRGSGASFGNSPGPFGPHETPDVVDAIAWAAAQPWSNGRVGMIGRSYAGISQYFAAAAAPPALRAIFPEMAMASLYDFAYPGGIFRGAFARGWDRRVAELDASPRAVPVDDDTDGALLAAAQREHRANRSTYELLTGLPYRDSGLTGEPQVYATRSPFTYRESIDRSGVAVCHLSGWLDIWVRDAVLWYRNLRTTQRLVIGPWAHGGGVGAALADLQDRWFAPYLKPGVGPEPGCGVTYAVVGAPGRAAWREDDTWPPAQVREVPLHLRSPREAEPASQAPALRLEAPSQHAYDVYEVDYRATSGAASRWANGYGGECQYPNMAPNDARALTYTTPPLQADVEIVGHPVVELYLSATHPDADVFCYLEEVDARGISSYVTEACLRASHRELAPAEFDNAGLPYHPSDMASLRWGLDEPARLVLDFLPVARAVRAGKRLRLAITGCDRDNAVTVPTRPAPVFRVHQGPSRPSRLRLPLSSGAFRFATPDGSGEQPR
jgi:uncharacterized protein